MARCWACFGGQSVRIEEAALPLKSPEDADLTPGKKAGAGARQRWQQWQQWEPHKSWVFWLGLVPLVALFIAHPWIMPLVVFTSRNTSYVQLGNRVDPLTYAVDESHGDVQYKVPKIIHQTWKDSNIPVKWQAARQSCMDLHPDWEFKLWTDESSRAFIAEEYPCLLDTYDSYPYAIQRADAIRYVLLYHFGGMYIDLDIECLRPLDFLRQYSFVMPQTKPVGFSNDFLVGAPKDPFLQRLTQALPRWNLNLFSKYPTVMFSTGPMFVTGMASWYGCKRELSVLPFSMYGKYIHAANPLFVHLHGSSWHGNDAQSVRWFVRHPLVLVVAGVALLSTLGGMLMWRRTVAKHASLADPAVQTLKMC